MRNKILLIVVLYMFSLAVYAQDSLHVSINKDKFYNGDTIILDYDYKFENKISAAVTLNLWIEDINTHQFWKYRYPLVNGSLLHSLIIGKDISNGRYALNFLIQKQFFAFYGHVRNYNKKSKGLNYMMLGKKEGVFLGTIEPDEDGNFKTPRFEFEDTSRFIFSSLGEKNNKLYIDATTPLDSLFYSNKTQTILINVGDSIITNSEYKFDQNALAGTFTLNQVVVNATKKKIIEKFDEVYSSGQFKGGLAKIFDGIESKDIANSFDILTFLHARIGGLQVQRVNNFSVEDGYNITWRGRPVDIYVDEFKIESSNQLYINPSDVAMIKVFAPLEGGPSLNGSICIYTKRGEYEDNERRYNFLVRGYTPSIIEWKK